MLALLLVPSAQAKPGALDPTFGTGGKVTTAIGVTSNAAALALQPDGKLVAAGASKSNSMSSPIFALARYNPNGSLDTGFGSGGEVTTAFGSLGDQPYGLTLQADGKLVAAGFHRTAGSGNDFALARYNTDGSLDASFNGGKVTTSFGPGNDNANGNAGNDAGPGDGAGLHGRHTGGAGRHGRTA